MGRIYIHKRLFRGQYLDHGVDLLMKPIKSLSLCFLLLGRVSYSAVAVDNTNAIDDHASFTGTSSSTSVTIASGDNLLLVSVANLYNGGTLVAPDAFTYGGV